MSRCFATIAPLVPPTSWLWLERPEMNQKGMSPLYYKADKNAGNEKKEQKRSALTFIQFRTHRPRRYVVVVALKCNKNTNNLWWNTSKPTDLVKHFVVKPCPNVLLLLPSFLYFFFQGNSNCSSHCQYCANEWGHVFSRIFFYVFNSSPSERWTKLNKIKDGLIIFGEWTNSRGAIAVIKLCWSYSFAQDMTSNAQKPKTIVNSMTSWGNWGKRKREEIEKWWLRAKIHIYYPRTFVLPGAAVHINV